MATFRDGIEAAAAVADAGGQPDLAARIRSIAEPTGQEVALAAAGSDDPFERWKAIYIRAGGFRNPKKLTGKGWDRARAKFKALLKGRKHDVEAILTGTEAYVRSGPKPEFVPAPEGFLNREQFLYDWSRGPNGRGPSPDDIENYFRAEIENGR